MRELTDEPEVEVKFRFAPTPDESVVLTAVHEQLEAGLRIVRLPAKVVIDYYFDTEDHALATTGATLRLRAKQSGSGFNANFKTPNEVPSAAYLIRREVRTQVSVAEAIGFACRDVPATGNAFAEAADFVRKECGREPVLRATVMLSILRQMYVVQPVEAAKTDHHLLAILFDTVSAYAIQRTDVERLLREGSVLWSPAQSAGGFTEVEIERTGTGPYRSAQDRAFELFQPLIAALEHAGGTRESATKYQRALDVLQLARSSSQLPPDPSEVPSRT